MKSTKVPGLTVSGGISGFIFDLTYIDNWASIVAQQKRTACNTRDPGWIPGLGISPGGGHSNPLLYSCLENPMDRGAWQATIHGVAKSQT